MLADEELRIQHARNVYKEFINDYKKADFSQSQRQALEGLVRFVNVIYRIVAKEEGHFVSRL